ncbi:hypothetical protein IFM89_021603 [Coptis chinensis]|uniref:Nuclear transcription factor Y subunit n=1 Tax=Coptis chinensis TaxID=261450 RepID=A0A835IE79_9MAGN|nr:hypothetical protein IFM89_021603 [Coptis chinensis]
MVRELRRMQSFLKKESVQSSVHSSVPGVVNCSSWWASTESQVPHSSLSNNLSLNMDSSPNTYHNVKQLQGQDSSSTQSTGKSHHEMATMRATPDGNCNSAHSDYNKSYGTQVEGQIQTVFSPGTSNLPFLPPQLDYSQSMVHMPYPYADPYYGGYLPAIVPQFIMNPQFVGMAPARVPLPPDFGEDEPIYVNSKQYRGILRRRQSRAKLEARNKLIKDRKPYLHESRHLHALNRARGCGGRFLNTKLEQSKTPFTNDGENASSESSLVQTGGSFSGSGVSQSVTGNMESYITCCSDISSISDKDNMHPPSNPRLSGYHPPMGTNIQDGGGIICNGSQRRVLAIQ